ncbi:hypothetical protein A7H1H_0672 [Aliarcobacter butzleri 7h1h]|uniref:anti-phage protein KwaB n=1 Tax=Aliarcobacter butzleri TaxID=28197 RepID=UPI0003023BC3|nr:anti-phage protein KwaB [Aliarcobacter butzleri]AGR76984.1 hypothetical protein A7H1H_0672 [Aliarcobacter butzleri 7h1h]
MNVDNLKSILQEILNSDVANIKLYATTKQNETKKISISSDVSDNLLELFKKSIEDMFLDDSKEYRLKSIDDNNDEAAKTYYYFNGENTYERLNVLHNLSSLDEEVFNFENTNLDDIETFYITISNGEKTIALYKKNYAINVLRRGKTIFFTKHNENIDELKKDILKIDHSFQFMAIENNILIVNLSMLETQLGYDEVITKKAQETVELIASLDFLEDIAKLEEMVQTKKIAKKINLVKNSQVLDIIQSDINKVKTFIDSIEDLKKSLKFTEDNKLKLNSKVGVERFLKLLDDAYLKSELTETLYDSLNKEKM